MARGFDSRVRSSQDHIATGMSSLGSLEHSHPKTRLRLPIFWRKGLISVSSSWLALRFEYPRDGLALRHQFLTRPDWAELSRRLTVSALNRQNDYWRCELKSKYALLNALVVTALTASSVFASPLQDAIESDYPYLDSLFKYFHENPGHHLFSRT
jgi:hypothetical protein